MAPLIVWACMAPLDRKADTNQHLSSHRSSGEDPVPGECAPSGSRTSLFSHGVARDNRINIPESCWCCILLCTHCGASVQYNVILMWIVKQDFTAALRHKWNWWLHRSLHIVSAILNVCLRSVSHSRPTQETKHTWVHRPIIHHRYIQ